MSIRIHKSIGYGLRDFSLDREFLDKFEKLQEIDDNKCFLSWIIENRNTIFNMVDNNKSQIFQFDYLLQDVKKLSVFDLYDFIKFDNEYSLEDAIMFIPIEVKKEWYRYDDMIDYTEETLLYKQENRWRWIDKGLYPYDKNKPPISIAALMLYLGIPEKFKELKEALYVWWS